MVRYHFKIPLIEGYTKVTTKTHDGTKLILYAHLNFQGKKWYDWAHVDFEELNSSGEAIGTYYPSKTLGFVTIHGITEAVIQCSEKPLIWSDLEEKFILKTIIGTNIDVSYVTVPISLLVLPKRNWSRYFGDRIMTEFDKYNL
jgi:hypothetical protein